MGLGGRTKPRGRRYQDAPGTVPLLDPKRPSSGAANFEYVFKQATPRISGTTSPDPLDFPKGLSVRWPWVAGLESSMALK